MPLLGVQNRVASDVGNSGDDKLICLNGTVAQK